MKRGSSSSRAERRKGLHQPPAAARPAPPADAPPPASPARFGAVFDKLLPWLPVFALVVVAAFALRRLDDFDTWWHLASGRWIAQHHAIPHTDVLSFTAPTNAWINLQWLYDLLLYAVYGVGGASGLVIASAACYIATFAILARHLARTVGPVASAALLIWVAATVNERFLIRPEMASFPLLAAVQLVLAGGRENPARLRWLVPLMILWANTHSLFILGVGAIGAAIGGALVAEAPFLPESWRRDSAWPAESRRALLVWGGAAAGATIVNPYLLRGLLFPVELITRINGSNSVYSAIGEFRRPFSGYFQTFALGSYQAFLFTLVGLAVVAGLLRAGASRPSRGAVVEDRERFDVGACAFAAALAWLSLLARRNIGIFAIGAVPFMGACVGIALARAPKGWRAPGNLLRAAAAVVLVAAVAIGSLAASNRWYAMTGETHEFGLGIFESNFQPRATQFFREQKLPGPTYNDLTAGGYLTWDDPSGKGVYVDGRLEVYDTPFFSAYMKNLTEFPAWKADADARGIQSVTLFHRWENRHPLIRALGASGEWTNVYYDETVVIFVRNAGHADLIDAARRAFLATWRARNDAALTAAPQTFGWQWSIDRTVGQVGYGTALQVLGDNNGALKWYELAMSSGLSPNDEVDARQRAAQCLVASGELARARVHLVRALELDPANEATRAMLRRLDELSGGNPTTLR
jgi:hypothetical protein